MNFFWKKYYSYGLLLFFLSTFTKVLGQGINIGVPPILNYVKERYEAGTHNWDIAQSKSGKLYFSNNDGLLEFDGDNWTTYKLQNQTICRSLHINEAGEVFVGGQGEFGIFKPDSLGALVYHSLNHLIPKGHEQFEDVWEIVMTGDRLFFRTTRKIYQLVNNKIRVYILEDDLLYMGVVEDQVWVQDVSGNLMFYDDDQFKPVLDRKLDIGIITGAVPLDSTTHLVSTLKQGLFIYDGQSIRPYDNSSNDYLKENWITDLERSESSAKIVVGTSFGGVMTLDENGRPTRLFTKGIGLQNNNINAVFFDHSDNLWLGLNNGIDYIEINSPFTLIHPDTDFEDPVYAVKLHDEILYIGTSNGLYKIPWQTYYDPLTEIDFELVEGSIGQVWGIDEVDGQLLVGHHEGDMILDQGKLRKFSPVVGAWKYIKLSDDLMVGGCYTGLNIFTRTDGSWTYLKTFKGFEESSRLIAKDEGNLLWVAHPYRGIFKLDIDANQDSLFASQYDSTDGLASDLLNDVFKINNEVVFTSEQGVYSYDADQDSFLHYKAFDEIIGSDKRVKELQEDGNGHIWFAANDSVGVIKVSEKGLKKSFDVDYFPFMQGKLLGGFEMISPIDDYNLFFGSDKGVYHFNPQKSAYSNESFNVYITKVQNNEEVVFAGHKNVDNQEIPLFDIQENGFKFHFSNNFYQDIQQVKYKYMLEGSDEDWSDWTQLKLKEYTNLSPGDYVFKVKAMDKYGNESEIDTYPFVIETVWYASRLVNIGIIFIGLAIAVGVILFQRNRYTQKEDELTTQQEQMKQAFLQNQETSEQTIDQLKNENLKSQIQFKNQELASTTMHLVQKIELMRSIQGELKKLTQSDKAIPTLKKDITKIIRKLNSDEQLDNEWEQFARHFDEVHSNFLKRISETFPQLKPNDHRLCAYLRMNLSTKEIAHLLNLSVRGVEASRYRLRKKINLDTNTNLTEFMMRF